ncbi:MAG: indolepyruvate ferredoxin oxidoreductase subunit beta [Candidatus Lokiarchaeota archaeon]|nr:indolepyruvate ferredoxin oxidoreductase subunit beta [Candidatus Lokiarchaeota archaeon]
MTYNIMTCGVGGQGLMLLSNVIGLACANSDLMIKTAETHGLAQRSGSIYTHIRVGEKVYSPLIPYGEADVLVAMEAIEALRNIEYLKKGGIVILNNYIWHPVQETYERVKQPDLPYINVNDIISQLKKVSNNIYLIEALDLAKKAGNPLTSNVVLLGALAKIDGFPISLDQIKNVIPQVVPNKAIDANLKALKIGFDQIK